MTERQHVGIERTILCATRFWSGGKYDASYGPGWNKTRWSKGATTSTLLSGVKHVVRKQGFTTAAINKALRKLERGGFVALPGGKVLRTGKSFGTTIALTEKGGRVGCASVKLAPWTNSEYPGSQLSGARRRRKR